MAEFPPFLFSPPFLQENVLTAVVFCFSVFSPTAMSSYLYIVKYELPTVIKAFTGANDE